MATIGRKDSDVYNVDIAGSLARDDGSGVDYNTMPMNAQFYWKMMPPNRALFTGNDQTNQAMAGFGPAPRLQPSNATTGTSFGSMMADHGMQSSGMAGSYDKPSTIVNVRDLHHWTESPVSSRREVPVLNLKEYRITGNAMLNQMIQNLGAAVGSGMQVWEMAKELLGKAKEDGLSGIVESLQASFTGGGADTGVQAFGGGSSGSADPMNPYSALYTTQRTGFTYILPYMTDTWADTNSSFGGEGHQTSGFTAGISKMLQGLTSDVLNLGVGMLTPGVFSEQSQFFNFSGRERQYTVKFPLFNTKSYAEVIRNWQFLFLLQYQCLPNRVNKVAIDPPCIYEAYVPGVWYSKYTALSNLRIDFKGARREMEIPITFLDLADTSAGSQGGSGKWLQQMRKMLTIIPDAYEVTITLSELFGDSQNSKYQLMRESMNQKIQTGSVPLT
jgi:hypothetical protein